MSRSSSRSAGKPERFTIEHVSLRSRDAKIEKGDGVQLGSIDYINKSLAALPPKSKFLKALHRICFPGSSVGNPKANLKKFSGFVFDEDDDVDVAIDKIESKLGAWEKKDLNSACSLFNLGLTTTAKSADCVGAITNFLMEPKKIKNKPKATRKKSTTTKKTAGKKKAGKKTKRAGKLSAYNMYTMLKKGSFSENGAAWKKESDREKAKYKKLADAENKKRAKAGGAPAKKKAKTTKKRPLSKAAKERAAKLAAAEKEKKKLKKKIGQALITVYENLAAEDESVSFRDVKKGLVNWAVQSNMKSSLINDYSGFVTKTYDEIVGEEE